MKYSIPDKRELSETEKEFLTFIFNSEKPEWIGLIDILKVIARCGCGECPSIIFGENYNSDYQNGKLIIDLQAEGLKGEKIGISVFGTDEMPTELEFYSIDGENEFKEIPAIKTFKRIN